MRYPLLYELPIWVIGVLLVVALLGALELGYRVGRWKGPAWKEFDAGRGGGVVLTSMFALLGLMLAFTYAFTVTRFDARKQAIVDEANAISTAFLRADLGPEPARTELRKLLLEYARTRATPNGTTSAKLEGALDRSRQVQVKLWPATAQMVKGKPAGIIEASIVQAINRVLDAHGTRVAKVLDRLPTIVLVMLVFITAASVAVAGFNSGISGGMNRLRMTVLTLVLASVIIVIIDFDLPQRGFIRVSQESLQAVIREMEADLANEKGATGHGMGGQ
jgi:hypothetical protein